MKIIVATNLILLAYALLSGCAPAADPGPVMHYELDGTWCSAANPVRTCLHVQHAANNPASVSRYTWERGLCYEGGTLSGGLEFTPDTTSRLCLPFITRHTLYSAAAEWTATGLEISYLNQSDGTDEGTSPSVTYRLDYQP